MHGVPIRKPLASSRQARSNPAMRIIAGEFRGRRLLSPETDATRPITDRVKQSLFRIKAIHGRVGVGLHVEPKRIVRARIKAFDEDVPHLPRTVRAWVEWQRGQRLRIVGIE